MQLLSSVIYLDVCLPCHFTLTLLYATHTHIVAFFSSSQRDSCASQSLAENCVSGNPLDLELDLNLWLL